MRKFIKNRFDLLAEYVSRNLGHPYAFIGAMAAVLLWAVTGPIFDYSDTWQLMINSATTIGTFLMVFLLQNTGNRGIDEMQRRIQSLEAQNQKLLSAVDLLNRRE